MKNLLILLLFACAIGWSQDRPIRADVVFLDTLTTTERDALTMRPSQFALIANSTVDSVQAWIVDKWVNLGSTGSGETYTFGTGLTNTSGTITVTNPFEEADETKLDGIETNATEDQSDAEISTAFLNENPNTDLDGSGTSVTAGTNVTVTGSGTSGSPYVINSTASGTGDVTGPASSTDNAIVRFDATTGKIIQNSVVTIGDTGNADFGGGSLTDIGQIDVNTEISAWNIQLQRPDGLAGDAFIELNDNNGNANVLFNDQSNSNKLTYTNAETAQTIVIDDLSSTDDQTAAEVPITDTGENFTATDVEGALAELATNSSDNQTASEVTVSATPVNYTPDDTSVEGHLAGIDDQLAAYTDSGQSLSPTTKSAGVQETYDNSDITNGGSAIAERKWNKHSSNDTILLGSGITRYNQPWLETLAGADSLYIKKDTGTTIYISDSTSAISGNGAILKGGRKSATIVAESSNVFYIFGEVTVHNEAVESPELYTVANALSTTNEADAITGLSLPSGGTITSIESSPSPQDGTSVIRFVEASAPDRIEISLTLEVGEVYDISYWAWNAGASGSAQTWVGFDEAYSQAFTSTPTQYSTSVTANSTSCTLRFYINTAGNTIYMDGLSVKKQL